MKKEFLIAFLLLIVIDLCLNATIFGKPTNSTPSQVYPVSKIEVLSNRAYRITFSNYTDEIIPIIPPLEGGKKREILHTLKNGKNIYFDAIGEQDDRADVVISEFCTKGNKAHPDAIEIYALTSGSLDGVTVTFTNGSYTFKNTSINKGEYLIITPREGLSQNNGEITITATQSKLSRVIDRVIYSNKNRTVSSLTWNGEAIDSRPSSATKTLCRIIKDGVAKDTNTKNDWYISLVNGRTFGRKNASI